MQHLDEGMIHAWLDGALSPSEAADVEAHVASCEQCAAAVAEARGLIAGASRILTALDNVPSGVVPVATVRKRANWPVWRAAAAIVVVALGSFVVLRDRIGGNRSTASDSAYATTAVARSLPLSRPNSPELSQAQVEPRTAPPGAVGNTAASRAPVAQSSSGSDQRKAVAGNAREAAPSAAVTGSVTRGEPAGFAAGAATSMDATSNISRPSSMSLPKSVGTRREIGRSTTLYELSPGDTVVLSELNEMRLGEVVVTGVQAAAPVSAADAARSMARTASPDTQRRAAKSAAQSAAQPEASSLSAQTTQSPIASAPAMAPVRTPTVTTDIAAAYNTISWTDSATGKKMTLSGRHSVAELEDIRARIERVRAAQSAEKKKEP